MLVSCIIPTYRRKEILKNSLESVLSQTYSNLEIIIINDNDKGDDFDIYVENMLQNFCNYDIKHFRTPTKGSGGAYARNLGIKKSTGNFIAFLDDDDIWLPNKIEKQIDKIFKEDCMACTCEKQVYRKNIPVKTPRLAKKFQDRNQLLEVMTRKSTLYTPTLLFNREVFQEGLKFDENLKRHQDLQLIIEFLANNGKFSVVDEVLVHVNADDKSNKPDLSLLREIKNDFFKSIDWVMNSLSTRDRKRVEFAHQLELVLLAIRSKKIQDILLEIYHLPFSISGFMDFMVRINRRK